MAVPSYTGRNRPASNGGPSGVQRSYASQLKEAEPLFNSYEHLQGLPRGDAALTMLRKVASLVKPIMRKRGWKVQILAEFLPAEQNLLGLNINKGYKICIRLRYHNNPDLFLPIEEVVDTLLHELSHNVWGDHDSNFHRLWGELRDEHEVLLRKGFTGEGFLSEGHRLGGGRQGVPPTHEMRRLARASAEKRKAQGILSKGSGQRLGGTPLHLHGDIRQVIADQVTRRNTISKGCASGRGDANKLADQSANNTFKTKAEEDDANDRAIAQALYELIEEEEERKLNGTYSTAPHGGGLAWSPTNGLFAASGPSTDGSHPRQPSEEEQLKWAMQESMTGFSTMSPTSPNNFTTEGLSPVSPLTPESQFRSVSAPPVPSHSKPSTANGAQPTHLDTKPTSRKNHQPSESPRKPVSRLVQTPDEQEQASKRKKSSVSTTNTAASVQTPVVDISEPFDPTQWTCDICTCINPMQFLACDACGTERPQAALLGSRPNSTPNASRWAAPPPPAPPTSLGWNCERCGSFMEHKWWT
jgi:DNA-dependent metalloprotease WSS1